MTDNSFVANFIREAAHQGVEVGPDDITVDGSYLEIDGMGAWEWLRAMTAE